MLHISLGMVYFGYVDRTSNECELDDSGECPHDCTMLNVFNTCTAAEKERAMSLIEALYMSMITLTTVGFGDFTPKSKLGRILGIFWMCSGVASAGIFIGAMQTFFLMRGNEGVAGAQAENIEREEFMAIDAIHVVTDGTVTRGEFMTHMLKKFHLVDEDVLDQITGIYDRLESVSRERLNDENAQNEVIYEDILALRKRNSSNMGSE